MIEPREVENVINGMKLHGGSFVMALGVALSHADHFNEQKIKDTWPELWAQYLRLGRK